MIYSSRYILFEDSAANNFDYSDSSLFLCISLQTAKRDEPSKKAYKLLATLHSDCGDLVTLVQETGQVQREVRDLEDQIEQERARNASANLEQLVRDLQLIETEAQELRSRIAQLKSPGDS